MEVSISREVLKVTTKQEIDGCGNFQAGRDIEVTNITNYRPLIKHFYPQDIKSVIEGFACCFEKYADEDGVINIADAESDLYEFDYIEKEKKNKLNSLSDEYFQYIQNEHLAYFSKIDIFLKDPKNEKLLHRYNSIAMIIRFRIATIRSEYSSFDSILGVIYDELMDARETILTGKEELCIIFINYMYWNCDIGKKS